MSSAIDRAYDLAVAIKRLDLNELEKEVAAKRERAREMGWTAAEPDPIARAIAAMKHAQRMVFEPPCHAKPREQWCDRNGAGGFMGHTCGGLS